MRKYLCCVVLLVMLLGCENSNLTKLGPGGVYARTTTANEARMTPEGDLQSSYQGIGASQVMQDPDGNWAQMAGPIAVLSVPTPSGTAYIISPKDTKIAKMSYTPNPKAGEPAIVMEGLEANISIPMSQDVAALGIALPALQKMSKEAALAKVEEWRIAGTMVPTLADILKSLISAMWPVAVVP